MLLAENVVIAQRFRLTRLLGRGGMGSVWQATHLGLDIPCAVKFIEAAHSGLADATARFEREAKAAAQLRSPNVVQILDHGVEGGTPYIAMELLEGEELGARLRRLQRLSPRDVLAVVRDVSRALTKAHGLGIVHRDLKPDNVFLVKDDDREIAKVLDFGIAKTQSIDLTAAKTQTGAMLGTPYYMSPEQAQGTRAVDSRSDLWSLAVIVFECLTGMRPFESDALGDLLMKILVLPIPVPSQIAQVPPGFDAWWTRAVSRDPAGRFQTAKDLAESLHATIGGAPDVAQNTGPFDGPPRVWSGPMANTPTPIGAPAPTAPWTPAPAQAPVWTPAPIAGPQVPGQTTGGAISRTLDGRPMTPAKRGAAAAAVAVAVIASLVVVGLGGAAVFLVRARSNATPAAAAAATAPAPPSNPAALPPAQPVDPPPAATAAHVDPLASAAATAAEPSVPAAATNVTAQKAAPEAKTSPSANASAKPRQTKPAPGAATPDRSGF